MEQVLASRSVSITELKRSPSAVIEQAGSEPVAVLNHNRPAAYLLPPHVYQAMLERTSTERAPWYVVPCDKKWYSRLAVTELLIEALKGLDLSWPPPDFDVEAEKRRVAAS